MIDRRQMANNMSSPEYIEVFFFADGVTLYNINTKGHAVSSQRILFIKKSRKVLKAVKKQIKEIKKLNPNYKILVRDYTGYNMRDIT